MPSRKEGKVRIVVVTNSDVFKAKATAELKTAHDISFASPAGFQMPDANTRVIIDTASLSEDDTLAIQAQPGADRRTTIGGAVLNNRLARRHLPDPETGLSSLFS